MASTATIPTFEAIEDRLDAILASPDVSICEKSIDIADELLALGEAVLSRWLIAHDVEPTSAEVEGFRLLALHRQGAKGDPSFNACRETCRELVYHRNLVLSDPTHADTARRIRLGAMVVRHLALFIGGKLDISGLGEFCCSSRSLRQADAAAHAETI